MLLKMTLKSWHETVPFLSLFLSQLWDGSVCSLLSRPQTKVQSQYTVPKCLLEIDMTTMCLNNFNPYEETTDYTGLAAILPIIRQTF